MSAERFRAAALALLYGLAVAPAAGAEEPPELELLEYLGSWEESDEDWVLFQDDDEERVGTDTERSDSVSQDKASQESDNES